MGLKTKTQPILAALALAVFPLASSASRTPDSTPAKIPDSVKKTHAYMPQADAFSTASEHATFMAAYQISYGPYGLEQDSEERNKMLKETAQAIETCINGGRCEEEKVLKAMVQYNMGQDIKRMMATNSTNKEKMKSIEAPHPDPAKDPKAGLQQSWLQQTMQTGKEFQYAAVPEATKVTDDTEYLKSAKEYQIARGAGTAKEPVFQLDEGLVEAKKEKEREILGDDFFREYGIFMKSDDEAVKRQKARFYKIVPAGETHVYAEENGAPVIDQQARARMEELQREQQVPGIEKALQEYMKNRKPMEQFRAEDGSIKHGSPGSKMSDLGLGKMVEVNGANLEGLNINDLKKDGALDSRGNAKAITRVVNQMFRHAAEKKIKAARNTASADTPAPPSRVDVGLDPESFDRFLDEIWPSSAKRREIMNRQ